MVEGSAGELRGRDLAGDLLNCDNPAEVLCHIVIMPVSDLYTRTMSILPKVVIYLVLASVNSKDRAMETEKMSVLEFRLTV